jgi:hypothetical protein
MSFIVCLNNALKEGEITKDRHEELTKVYLLTTEELIKQGINPTDSAINAAKQVYDNIKHEIIQKKLYDREKIRAQQNLITDIKNYRNRNGEADYAQALDAVLNQFNREAKGIRSLESIQKMHTAIAFSKIDDVIKEFKTPMGGKQTKAQKLSEYNMAIAILDGNSKDPLAAKFAKGIEAALEYIRTTFNSYGGNIGKLKNYLPQIHNALKLRAAGMDQWIKDILPKLDLERIIDNITGSKFNEETIVPVLKNIWETVITEGNNKLTPGERFGQFTANKSRVDHRFLHFKTGEDWLAYAEKYGNSNVFDSIISHIHSMTTDIALFDRFGPNPGELYSYIKQYIKKQSAADDIAQSKGTFERKKTSKFLSEDTELQRTDRLLKTADNMMDTYMGKFNNPHNIKIAAAMSSVRNYLMSAQLGSAVLLTPGDFNLTRITNHFNGLPQVDNFLTTVKLIKEGITGENPATAKISIGRLQLITDSYLGLRHQQAKFQTELLGTEFSKRVSDATLRLSGLSHVTQSGQWGFGMNLFGHLAKNISKQFDELHPSLQESFKRYGINENDWNVIRSTELYDAGKENPGYAGVTFVETNNIRLRTDLPKRYLDDLAFKLHNFYSTESEFAVPTSTLKARAYVKANAIPGTFKGELILSAAMYKQFALTSMITHLYRGLDQASVGKYGYFSNYFISTTLMGALSNELKQLAKGQQTTDVDYIKKHPFAYWSKAVVTGGGLSIWGDFIGQDLNSNTGNIVTAAAGPVAGLIQDVGKVAIGNTGQLLRGEKMNIASEASNFVRRYTPGHNIWYGNAVFERVIMDNIQRQIDSNYHRRNSHLINKYQKQGVEYWWRPGDTTP